MRSELQSGQMTASITSPAVHPPARRRPRQTRLALLAAGALAALACAAGTVPAAQAATTAAAATTQGLGCPYDGTGNVVLASQVMWGGTLYAGPRGDLVSPEGIQDAETRGWDSTLISYYGHYMLTVQDDGNIVLHHVTITGAVWCGEDDTQYVTYDDLGVVWASGQTYIADRSWPTILAMQGDGNLVDYNWYMEPLWASGSNGSPQTSQYRLVVQDDGNLVIYLGSQPIWDRHEGSRR